MSGDLTGAVADTVAKGANNAAGMAPETSAFDVWSHTADGLSERMGQDPAELLAADLRSIGEAAGNFADQFGEDGEVYGASAGDWIDSAIHQQDALKQQFGDMLSGETTGPDGQPRELSTVERIGMGFSMLTGLEQMISTMVSVIPFPAFPALRITDMDVGFPHGHMHPPNFNPPVVPSPIPFPSTGPIIPIPFLSGANTVTINGMPAARCGDMGLGVWCGGYFPMYEVFLGSSSVWLEGARAGRILCDITKHCIFSTPRPSDFPVYTFLGTTISASPNVMIGGVPMPSLAGMAMGAAFGAAFRRMGRLIRRAQATEIGERLATRVQQQAARAGGALGISDKARDRVSRGLCHLLGHPVDAATGKVLAEALDIDWDGPMPLRFRRVWASTSGYLGPLGAGWHHSYDMGLVIEGRAAVVRLADGRQVAMPAPGDASARAEGMTLTLTAEGPELSDAGRRYLFGAPGAHGVRPLIRIRDRHGAETRLVHDRGLLRRIEVVGGQTLEIETDAKGRIAALHGPDPETGARIALRRYVYDAAGDLVEVRDAYDHPTRYAWKHHLLIRETDRNGYSYHFEYDRHDITGRCLRTWGDGPALDLRFSYEPFARRTTVETESGRRVYRHDALGRVTELTDAAGGVTRWAFEGGSLVRRAEPDGTEIEFAPDGARTVLRKGVVIAEIPAQADMPPEVTLDASGRVASAAAEGLVTRHLHDGGWTTLTGPAEGPPRRRETRDFWGRVVAVEENGQRATFAWDLENRVVAATTPRGTERYGWDAGGRLVSRTDPQGRVERFAHSAEALPAACKRADGSVIHAEHDMGGGLGRITDANGAETVLRRDGEGRVVEIHAAGRRMRIARDASGAAIRVERPLSRTEIRTDARPHCLVRERRHRGEAGVMRSTTRIYPRLRQRDYADDAVRATTREDTFGRLIHASFAGHEFDWTHDGAAETGLSTPWGEIAIERDAAGLTLTDPLGGRHHFGADGVARRPNGAVDETRRPPGRLHRHLHLGAETLYAAEARFRGGLRRTEHEQGATRRFSYDPLDRLVAVEEAGRTDRFAWDAEFNLLEGPEGRFAIGPDQILTGDGRRRYRHDAEGRCTAIEDGARTLLLEHDPRGFLARVRDTVSGLDMAYTHDDFGRRVAKRGFDPVFGRVDISCVWAGPRLAAERDNLAGRLRHYIYLPLTRDLARWTPVAFIDHEDGARHLYTVHLGLGAFPVLVLDDAGRPVWRARHTPMGAAIEDPANAIAFDFRLPGQILDRETGLHHTRFRHHDPRTNRFLQPDPLFPLNASRLYAYSQAPLDRPDLLGLAPYDCSKGGTAYSDSPHAPTAHRYSYTQHGGARDRRIALARDRIRAGEYDPLLDTIEPHEVEHFVETGQLPRDVQWHHTNQISADPAMADEVGTLAPVRTSEHAAEHGGSYATSPTAGIRGDVTTPDRPIYDPNDPDVVSQRYGGDSYRDRDPQGIGEGPGQSSLESRLPPDDASDLMDEDGNWILPE